MTAAQALELGLVHRVVPEERLLAETQATVARLARHSPVAVQAAKRAVYFATRRPLSRGLDHELAGYLAAGSTRAMARNLPTLYAELNRLGGSPVLADPQPWIEGTKGNLVG